MEFFIIADINTSSERIQDTILLERAEQFCASIVILEQRKDSASIGTGWGEFKLSRQVINGGLRFALVDCPNALAWTITTGYPPREDKTVIHLTINRTEKSDEFVQSVMEFGQEWKDGLEEFFA